MRNFLFELWEGLRSAMRAIRVNKMRSVLTTLGIIIGILSVTAMATVVNGLERGFDRDMAELGTDVLYVEKWPWVGGPGFNWWDYINRPEITADLADVIRERSRYTTAATPVVRSGGSIASGSTTLTGVSFEGATPDYARVHTVNLARGTFFSDVDERAARNVAVIGAEVAEQLFPLQEPLGKNIRIAGERFQVLGVLAREGSGADGGDSDDLKALMPFNTFKKLFGVRERSVSVQVRVTEAALMPVAKDELTGILRVARKLDAKEENDFVINDQQNLRAQIAPVKAAIYSIGIGLTALALLVGGIGVMNIMFVSVKERTREIGIRKAVGAKPRTVLTQFLIEAVIICVLGGMLGVLLSVPITLLIKLVLPAYLGAGTVITAFVICVLIGTAFGLAPAWTAARAEPIEALRYE